VADILSSGPDGARRRLILGAVVAVAAVATGTALVTGRLSGPDPAPRPVASESVASESVAPTPPVTGEPLVRDCDGTRFTQVPGARAAALLFDGLPTTPTAFAVHDRNAGRGPWAVVVRRLGGSLGRSGAVVTFPVPAATGGRVVRVDRVAGRAVGSSVVWPIAGRYARIRGDLSEAQRRRLAALTSVARGRPVVDVPRGYRVVSRGAYQPTVIREARYASAELGVAAVLGDGLTSTGVLRGGGFEDQFYAGDSHSTSQVDRRPAVFTSLVGGNAAVAWEPAPGIVAYVLYSGAKADGRALSVLQLLAERACVVDVAQWEAVRPQTVMMEVPLG
jgi:hypothetical protein